MNENIKKFIKHRTEQGAMKGEILSDFNSWGWFDVQETWDEAVKEGLIKQLNEHYWIWYENYEIERWIQWQMKEYGYSRIAAEANYYRWTQ